MAESQKYPVVLRTESIIVVRETRGPSRAKGWLDRIERVRFRCAFKISRPDDERADRGMSAKRWH